MMGIRSRPPKSANEKIYIKKCNDRKRDQREQSRDAGE